VVVIRAIKKQCKAEAANTYDNTAFTVGEIEISREAPDSGEPGVLYHIPVD